MKNLFKAIGRKTYFSFKRFARAMKSLNIFTFSAVFLASSLMPTSVIAAGDFVRATITPSNSVIELDESKTFSVITKLNGMVTDADSIQWTVDGVEQGNSSLMTYIPTVAGEFLVRVNVVKNGIPANSLATLTVNEVGGEDDPDDNVSIQAVISPSSSTINEDESKTFTVIVKNNGVVVDEVDSISWFVNDSPQPSYKDLVRMTISPDVGIYRVRVNVIEDKIVDTSSAILTVLEGNEEPADPDFLRAVVTPSSSVIDEGESKRFDLITKLNGFATTPDSIRWFVGTTEQVNFRDVEYLDLSLDAGVYSILAIVTKENANVSQSSATLIVREGITPPPVDDFVRAVITPSSSTVSFGTNKRFNLITKLNGFNHLADSIEWRVDGVHQTQADNQTYIDLNLPVDSYRINARAWINGVMDDDYATLIVKEVIITDSDDIHVTIVPNIRSVYEYAETTYTAVVRNDDGIIVTDETVLNWSILDNNAVIVYENHDTLRVRALGNIGTFENIYVYATRNVGEADFDKAELNVMDRTIPPPPPPPVCDEYLTATIHGVIEDGSSPSAGDNILYTVRINNYHPCVIHNISLKIGVPDHTSYVGGNSLYGMPQLSGNYIYWSAGTLFSGQEKVMNFRVRIYDDVPANGWYITAYGSANGNEIDSFNIQSNQIFVPGSTTPPLPPTGIDWITLLLIIMASLGMATLTYAWMYSRQIRHEARF